MNIRAFNEKDLANCLDVEFSAIKGDNHYLNDVLDYYSTTKGEFTVVEIDEKVVGMGKFTVLFDGSAWLELLRVHQDYQRKGCGMAIYQRYKEQLEEFNCPAMRMYTGEKNVASAELAKKNGFELEAQFHAMTLNMNEADASLFWEPPVFRCLNSDEAVREIMSIREECGGFLSINNTYYEINEKTCRGFAAMGWVYGDGKGNVLVAGSRFQPNKALYIAAMGGDKRKALSYALNLAVLKGQDKISAYFPSGDEKQLEFLQKHGFVKHSSDTVIYKKSK